MDPRVSRRPHPRRRPPGPRRPRRRTWRTTANQLDGLWAVRPVISVLVDDGSLLVPGSHQGLLDEMGSIDRSSATTSRPHERHHGADRTQKDRSERRQDRFHCERLHSGMRTAIRQDATTVCHWSSTTERHRRPESVAPGDRSSGDRGWRSRRWPRSGIRLVVSRCCRFRARSLRL